MEEQRKVKRTSGATGNGIRGRGSGSLRSERPGGRNAEGVGNGGGPWVG